MVVNEQDIELLEMYLDHELSDDEARSFDERLSAEPQLQSALDRLRSHRQLRIAAMSSSFDSDAASIERLVASVRAAEYSESEVAEVAMSKASAALTMKRRTTSPIRSIFAAAACVVFGLVIGVAIQRQQAPNGLVASPAMNSVGSFGTNVALESHGTYVVSLVNPEGREVMRVRFAHPEQARQFSDSINNRSAPLRTMNVNNATILEEPY